MPRYLCDVPPEELQPATMDVDLGLSLAVKGVFGHRIADRLRELGFHTDPEMPPPGVPSIAKFYRSDPGLRLCIELLADRPTPESPRHEMLDNLLVPTLPGIGRALAQYRNVEVDAPNLAGATRRLTVKVCEIGPFLCLKLMAFASGSAQRFGKDAFDIVHSVVHYQPGGARPAAAAFAEERRVNPVFASSVTVLRETFSTPEGRGPRDYAEFCLGGLRGPEETDDFRQIHEQRLQIAALVGDLLVRAATRPA